MGKDEKWRIVWKEKEFQKTWRAEMGEKSSFPYRKYDRKPHPYIVKQILEDHQMTEMMKEVLIQEGKPCPFCHRKLGEKKEKGSWE